MLRRYIVTVIVLLLLFSSLIPITSSYSSYETNKIYSIHIDENGTLSGYVKDISMHPIEGARVRVYFHDTWEENYTDSSGYYNVTNIPICWCLKNATASKDGYTTEWVLLAIDENTTLDFILTHLGKTLYVGGDGPGNYTRIQDAIDNASDEDTVFVFSGVYYENNINIKASITLIGEGRNTTIIDAKQEINAICLYTKNININGLNIKNASRAGINFQSNNSHHVNISNNIFSNNAHAIHPYFPNEHTIVSNNIFSDNYNGFTLVGCINARVYQNIFINNYRSIGIYGSEYCEIFQNNFQYSKKCGIFLYGFSKFNYIHHNNFIKDSNSINAYFVQFSHKNIWDENYWNEPKIMPYPIIGSLGLGIPSWINFDWHPAREPYDILP